MGLHACEASSGDCLARWIFAIKALLARRRLRMDARLPVFTAHHSELGDVSAGGSCLSQIEARVKQASGAWGEACTCSVST